MSLSSKIINFIKSNFGLFLFGLFFVILFRDFLYTYRIQVEKFLPYYPYQDQIMHYITGDSKYDVEAPMNLRFLGLLKTSSLSPNSNSDPSARKATFSQACLANPIS